MHLIAVILALVSPGDTPEWGGFRGSNGSGVAESASIPDALDPEGNVLWRVEVPGGYSSPIVSGDRVFLTATEGKRLLTLCLDRATGEIRWERELEFDGKRPGGNSSASPTPATDGERVYAVFHSVGLIAYDFEGEELWRKTMGFNLPHGMATSPVVHGDVVVLLVDQDTEAHLIALDKVTGEERWKALRPGVTHSYSTPAIYEPEEGPAQVIVSGSLQISGYSLVDGEKLWWVGGSAWQTKCVPVIAGDTCFVNAYMVPSAEFGIPKFTETWEEVLAERDEDGDGKIARDEWDHGMLQMAWFIYDLDNDDLLDEKDYAFLQTSGTATGGLFAIRLGGRGNVSESHVRWKYDDRRGLPDVPTPIYYQDALVMIKEGGILSSFDPENGEVVKQGRVGDPDQYFASPVAADGKIILASVSGQLAVVSGGREWEVLSVNTLDEDVWSTPAIAGDQVFVRSQDALYCFQGDPPEAESSDESSQD
ncbi:MAG: PQQ-binding-like beta-propeller repeat protein [Planctomycetota bacterium]|nr:PQQ-binding-like beta-propeller repeat protein [Planctomycetota bacterium]